MSENLPDFLQNARSMAAQEQFNFNDQALFHKWQDFIKIVKVAIPEINYDNSFKLLSLGPISPGCLACRRGDWDCFFVTSQCNLDCDFCISQNRASDNFEGSNLGDNIDQAKNLYHLLSIRGISFSGGEALLKKEKLFSLLKNCSEDADFQHIWLYTNGMLLDEGVIKHLAECGLSEIRFNTAASGYQHPYVMEMMNTAAKYLKWVTVEIPLLPSDETILLDSLEKWAKVGVRALNIHELIYEPNSNSAELPGERQTIRLPDGHKTAVSPYSDAIASKVFKHVVAENLDLGVNYCSTVGKWRQLTARRERLLRFTKEPDEKYLGEGVLEGFYCLKNGKAQALPREKVETLISSRKGERFFHLKRMAPLSLQAKKKQWFFFEELT